MGFRAPPPSPIRRHEVHPQNSDVLEDFIHRTISVPDLILPKRRPFHRQTSNPEPSLSLSSPLSRPPLLDLQRDRDQMRSAAERVGCFQLVNHGISKQLLKSATTASSSLFQLSPDQKRLLTISEERKIGFEQADDDKFRWCRRHGEKEGQTTEQNLEGNLQKLYKMFGCEMEMLWAELDDLAEKITTVMQEVEIPKEKMLMPKMRSLLAEESMLWVYRRREPQDPSNLTTNPIEEDAVKFLIRSSVGSRSLSLHYCGEGFDGSFQIYSKRGSTEFKPSDGALVVTIGDALQRWSGGVYKHAVGKPITRRRNKAEEEAQEENDDIKSLISFVYCHGIKNGKSSSLGENKSNGVLKRKKKTITLANQVKVAILMVIIYHIIAYFRSLSREHIQT